MANVLLIHPDSGYNKIGFSLTLATIGGSLKKHGLNVFYILFDLPWNKDWNVSQSIKNIDIVGITVTSCDFDSALKIASEIKNKNPKIPIIAGGAHSTFDPESLLNNGFDLCVRGEGDYTIIEVVDVLTMSKNSQKSLKTINGISYKTSNGKILNNADIEIIQNLDDLPLPDWYQDDYKRILEEHQLPEWDPTREAIIEPVDFTLMIESSRGCPYKCVFCTTSKIKGKKWRGKSPERMIAEYTHFRKFQKKVMGLHKPEKKILIQFPDDNFCYDHKRVETFCKKVLNWPETNRPFWSVMARANKIKDKGLLLLMKRAGCVRIFMGAESGYAEGLKKIKKGITLEVIEKAVNAVLKTNFPILIVSWIIGFPWEKRREALKTIIAALKIAQKDPDTFKTSIFTFTPIVGADITETIGSHTKGQISDHARYESWGFNHPHMNDDDLFELQMIARWFVYLLGFKNHIPLNAKDFKNSITEVQESTKAVLSRIENKNSKLLFKQINKLFFTHTKSKPEILIKAVNKKIPVFMEIIEDELKNLKETNL